MIGVQHGIDRDEIRPLQIAVVLIYFEELASASSGAHHEEAVFHKQCQRFFRKIGELFRVDYIGKILFHEIFRNTGSACFIRVFIRLRVRFCVRIRVRVLILSLTVCLVLDFVLTHQAEQCRTRESGSLLLFLFFLLAGFLSVVLLFVVLLIILLLFYAGNQPP